MNDATSRPKFGRLVPVIMSITSGMTFSPRSASRRTVRSSLPVALAVSAAKEKRRTSCPSFYLVTLKRRTKVAKSGLPFAAPPRYKASPLYISACRHPPKEA